MFEDEGVPPTAPVFISIDRAIGDLGLDNQ